MKTRLKLARFAGTYSNHFLCVTFGCMLSFGVGYLIGQIGAYAIAFLSMTALADGFDRGFKTSINEVIGRDPEKEFLPPLINTLMLLGLLASAGLLVMLLTIVAWVPSLLVGDRIGVGWRIAKKHREDRYVRIEQALPRHEEQDSLAELADNDGDEADNE